METEMTQLPKDSSASSDQDDSNDQEHNEDGSRSTAECAKWKDMLAGKDQEIKRLQGECSKYKEDMKQIDLTMGRLQEEISKYEEKLQQKNIDIGRLKGTCSQNNFQLDEKDNTIKRLQEEISKYEEKLQQKNIDIGRIKGTCSQNNFQLDEKDNTIKRLQEECSKYEEKLKQKDIDFGRLKGTCSQNKLQLDEKDNTIKSLQQELQTLKSSSESFNQEFQRTIDEQDMLKDELKASATQVERLKDVEAMAMALEKTNFILSETKRALENTVKQKMEREKTIKEDAKQKLERTETRWKNKLQEKEDELKSLQGNYKTEKIKLLNEWNLQVERMQTDLDKKDDALKKIQWKLDMKDGALQRLQHSMENVQKERDDYQVRLSALMSTKLTTNNPEITDLSDTNRPTKLAEQWGELYDNEYTELFEALQCVDEKKIFLILKLLKRSFEICQEIREQGVVCPSYLSENNTMHNPLFKMEEEGDKEPRSNEEPADHEDPESASSKGDKNEETKDSRSNGEPGDIGGQDSALSLGDINKGGESQVDPEPESEIENKEGTKESRSNGEPGDDAGQDSASSLVDKNEGCESQVNPDPKHGIDDTKGGESQVDPDTESEIDTKEGDKKPRHNEEPVDHEDPESASSKGDKNTDEERNYQADSQQLSSSLKQSAVKIDDNQKQTMDRCSQTATTEMVKLDVPDELKRELMLKLSPYLRKKALEIVDILNKELPERVAKEFDMAWKTGNALDVYLKSCIRLCWLMGIQSPPVYIRFDEHDQASRHVKLDKHFYREYTKAGQHIDYVVWPPLQLYKEGPLLYRGVAQGTDSKD